MDTERIHDAAKLLGGMTSPKKKMSSRRNGKLGGRPKKPQNTKAGEKMVSDDRAKLEKYAKADREKRARLAAGEDVAGDHGGDGTQGGEG